MNGHLTSQRIRQYVLYTECTVQGNEFELITMVKMETINPVEGYFGSEFSAICNHCGVMAALTRKTLKKFLRNFCIVFGKMTSFGKIFKSYVPKIFTVTPIDVLCSNFVKFGRRDIVR